MLVQSGRPVGVMRTHEWAPRVLIANSNLVGGLGDLAGVPPARAARPDDVRPDDRRLVDLHRHPGHPAGHLRDVRGGRRQAVRRHAGRHADGDRRLRRHGRRAAARGDAQRRRLPGRRRRPDPAAAPGRAPLPRRGRRRPRRRDRAGARRPRRPSVAPLGRPGRQLRDRAARAAPPRASRSTSSPTRPRRTTRWPTCPRASTWPTGTTTRRSQAGGVHRPGAGRRWPSTSRRWSASWTPGAEVFDYGNSIRDEARHGRLRARLRLPRLRARRTSGRCSARARARSGGPRCPATRRTSPHRPGRARPVPGQRPPAPLDPRGAGPGGVPGPAGPDLLAGLRRAGQGRAGASTTWSPPARSRRRS